MMNKKGVSAVVATVLVVMISVSAVALIWGTVLPVVEDNLAEVSEDKAEINIMTSKGYTAWHSDLNATTIQFSRGNDDSEVSAVVVILSNSEGDSREFIFNHSSALPQKNSQSVYTILDLDNLGKPTNIEMYVIYADGTKGKIITGTTEIKDSVLTGRSFETFIGNASQGSVVSEDDGVPVCDYGAYGFELC